ncbi:MAG: recombinase family protein, partial [Elusimicrobia bacterium]|nr:recombinase family protein [Elusimicrobiota bacterium]
MKTKFFLYARKSTEDEERQVMSIEAQITELREYAKKEKISIAEEFIESKSAKKPGRKIFNNMIEKIKQSKESIGLLAWHPDRLARNSVDGGQIIYLIDTGKISSLRFPTFWFEPTPQGLFMLQVAFGQSKYYSDNLSENVKRGIRQKLRRGEWPTLAPFGYVNNPKTRNIEPDPVKARIIKKIFDEFAQGKHTLQSISERLSFWGVVSKNGTNLCKATIQRILTNPVYIGLIVHKGETYEGKFKPIISRATFEKVQKILKERAKPRKSKKRHNFPFTGLMKCGECGASITAQYAHGNGGTYRYYRCTKRLGSCSQGYLREELLAEQLRGKISKVALCEDWTKKMLAKVDEWEKEQNQSSQSFAQNLKKKMEKTEQKIDKLVNAFLDGIIEKDIYLKKKDELIRTKAKLLQKKSDFGRKGNNWIEPLRNWILDAHHAEKLALSKDLAEIKSFVKKIGTNRRLLDKTFLLDWKKPWSFLVSLDGELKNPSKTGLRSRPAKKLKNQQSPVWS